MKAAWAVQGTNLGGKSDHNRVRKVKEDGEYSVNLRVFYFMFCVMLGVLSERDMILALEE